MIRAVVVAQFIDQMILTPVGPNKERGRECPTNHEIKFGKTN